MDAFSYLKSRAFLATRKRHILQHPSNGRKGMSSQKTLPDKVRAKKAELTSGRRGRSAILPGVHGGRAKIYKRIYDDKVKKYQTRNKRNNESFRCVRMQILHLSLTCACENIEPRTRSVVAKIPVRSEEEWS
ncbi:hypothetical protein TNCT_219061 [Trichonephila clavata]|uniref:Uncharacterized protein n=1 Tax=Trichonephila clavata TaxID=2740835 RepID=A0A8X6II04_TRICU|nr:hypothetical protein TNCT_219061 [Trichonephila clavata]